LARLLPDLDSFPRISFFQPLVPALGFLSLPGFTRPQRISGATSVQFARVLAAVPKGRVLVYLLQKAIADRKRLDLRAHEAGEGFLGRAYYGPAPIIEAGIHQHGASRSVLERGGQRMIAGVRLLVHRLEACRVIGMTREVGVALPAGKVLLLGCGGDQAILGER